MWFFLNNLAIFFLLITMWDATSAARQRRKGREGQHSRQHKGSDERPSTPNSPFGHGSTFFSLKQSIFPTHQLITFCGMPKIGITDLRSGLAHHVSVPLTLPPPVEWPEAINKRGEKVVTSVLIRGPFSRFVSWYRSKILIDISRNGVALGVMNNGKSAKHKDRRILLTGRWNAHLLDAASDTNTTIYPIEVYARALLNKGDEFRRNSLDPHLKTQTQLCRLDHFKYDVVGAIENVSHFVDDLRVTGGEPAAIPASGQGSGADGQDCKRHNGQSAWTCSDALKHDDALLRHKNFKWSHHHSNNGAQTWEQDLSCEMRLLLYEIYTSDFKELGRLGFNFTKDLCVCDGGDRLSPEGQ